LNPEQNNLSFLNRAFPFHFVLGDDDVVVSTGSRLPEVMGESPVGLPMEQAFEIIRPRGIGSFMQLRDRREELMILRIKGERSVSLRGQFFVCDRDANCFLVFLGHPWIQELDQLDGLGLTLSDFPPHAGMADMLVHLQTKESGLKESKDLAQRLEATTRTLSERNLQLEEQLRERERLQETVAQAQKMQAIGQLAGGVAHDFNNILLAIDGHAELAALELQKGLDPDRHLVRIREATRRATELTSRLLSFARRNVMVNSEVDLDAAFDEAIGILGPLLGEGVRIETSFSRPTQLTVFIDASALQQVIINLAINARDAMEGSGLIRLEAEKIVLTNPKPLSLGSLSAGSWVRISMIDEGHGIPAEHITQVLEPFFTTKESGVGTGLGLSTVLWILDNCGGAMDIQSKVGEGTRIDLFLRESSKVDALPDLSPKEAAEEQSVRQTLRILLVEDEERVRTLVKEMLLLDGHSVVDAESPEKAISVFRSSTADSFDLVLTDLVLVGGNGRDLIQKLGRMGYTGKSVIMTGYDPDQVDPLIDGEVVLNKPFTLYDLRVVLDEV